MLFLQSKSEKLSLLVAVKSINLMPRLSTSPLGARSAINIQLRFVDGKAVIFEINPRYSGTSSFRAIVGYNEPDVMIRKHLLGETIEPGFPYEEGVILRGLDEVFVPAKELSGLGE